MVYIPSDAQKELIELREIITSVPIDRCVKRVILERVDKVLKFADKDYLIQFVREVCGTYVIDLPLPMIEEVKTCLDRAIGRPIGDIIAMLNKLGDEARWLKNRFCHVYWLIFNRAPPLCY